MKTNVPTTRNQTGRVLAALLLLVIGFAFTGCNTSYLTATPNPMDFGSVSLTQSKDMTLSVTFDSGITGTYIAVDSGANPGDFQVVSQTCIGGSGTQSAVIRFKPAAAGTRSATLTIIGKTHAGPQGITYMFTRTVALSGSATPVSVAVSPNPADFGIARLGQSKDLTLNVLLGVGVTVTSLAIDGGANPGDFQIVSQTCVGGTGNCSAAIRFTPAAAGDHSATLTLKGTLAGSAFTTTVPLMGADPQTRYMYLSGYYSNAVHRYYATSGAPAGTFAAGLNGTHGLTFGPDGDLYVCSSIDNRIVRYDGGTGAFKSNFITSSAVNYPMDAVFGPDGSLYVASQGGSAILRYNGATAAFLDTFATTGVNAPNSLLFMPGGDLLVTSKTVSNVTRYNGATGAFLGAFIVAGSGGLNNPASMTFGPDGNLYIASYGSNSILRYNSATGAFIDAFVPAGSGGLSAPHDLSFGADGNLYVVSSATNSVLRYNGTTGAFLNVFVSAGSGGVSTPTFFTFFPSAALRTVGGTVTLEGMSSAAQPLAFTFRPAAGSAFTRAVTPDSAGGYTVLGIPAAVYTVSIKGVKWLRKNISVDARAANVTDASVTLLAGDANNDNSVDGSDFGLLIGAFNSDSSIPGSGYDSAADFNCDGVVDSSDFGLLIGNYGSVGAP